MTPQIQKRDQKQGSVQFNESFFVTWLETCYSWNGHDIRLQTDYQYLHYNSELASPASQMDLLILEFPQMFS